MLILQKKTFEALEAIARFQQLRSTAYCFHPEYGGFAAAPVRLYYTPQGITIERDREEIRKIGWNTVYSDEGMGLERTLRDQNKFFEPIISSFLKKT